MDENHLLHQLTQQLLAQKLTITTAESCTGGMLGALLTELPGSSRWFERGFITYSNAAKQELLGVDESVLQRHGAVSIAVAEAMAQGALMHSHAVISAAITGIAGPDGGTAEKPVGLVCFAFAYGTRINSHQCFFPPQSTRQQIRHWSCIEALQGLIALVGK